MTMTKAQCKKILKQAKAAGACGSNYKPAKKAYKAGDYDTFEQICRGNISWLDHNSIEFPDTVAGEYIYYYGGFKIKGVLNQHAEPAHISIRTDDKSGAVAEIEVKDSLGVTYYKVEQQRSFNLQESNQFLKKLADEIYKHLDIEPTP